MTQVYLLIAKRLTEFENHRTETEHENSLIHKFFAVQFINAFAALYYIAFVENYMGDGICHGQPCFYVLYTYIAVLLASRPIVVCITKVIVPALLEFLYEQELEGRLLLDPQFSGQTLELSQVEKEFHMPVFDSHFGFLEEYSDAAIQFALVVMFAAACPISPVFLLITNYLKIRFDGKLNYR